MENKKIYKYNRNTQTVAEIFLDARFLATNRTVIVIYNPHNTFDLTNLTTLALLWTKVI